jgi:hypothetical protein
MFPLPDCTPRPGFQTRLGSALRDGFPTFLADPRKAAPLAVTRQLMARRLASRKSPRTAELLVQCSLALRVPRG